MYSMCWSKYVPFTFRGFSDGLLFDQVHHLLQECQLREPFIFRIIVVVMSMRWFDVESICLPVCLVDAIGV